MFYNLFQKNYINFIYFCIVVAVIDGVLCLSTFGLYYPELAHLYSRFHKVLRCILIIIALMRLFNSFSIKRLLITLCFIFFIIFSKTKTWLIFDLFFIPIIFNDCLNIKKTYKTIFVTVLISSFVVYVCYYFDIFQTINYKKFGSINVQTLGFRHPNFLAFSWLLISALYLTLRDSIRLFDICFVLFFTVLCVFLTHSRTSSFLFFCLFIVSFICYLKNKVEEKNKKILFYSSVFLYLCLIILFFFLAFSEIGNNVFKGYFGTFGSRLSLGKTAFIENGFSLLGQNIYLAGDYEAAKGAKYFVVDSSVFYYPIVTGILPSLFIFTCHIVALRFSILKNDLKLFFIQIIFFIFEFLEITSLETGLSMFLYFLPFSANKEKINY